MKIRFTIILLISSWGVHAQNLIPNPGFDNLTDCPTNPGQIYLAEHWESASNGSPGVFNECSNQPLMQVPAAGEHFNSYQIPRSGEGYASIFVYNNNTWAGSPGNSEYLEVQLLQPLQKGKEYYLEFYVSPDYSNGYTDAIGMAFSETFHYEDLDAMESLSLSPVIENRNEAIKDTVGWTKISGCYVAKGGEAYAIIGNFRTTDETLVEFEQPSFPYINYLYVEDVMVMSFDPLPDTILLCDGVAEDLDATFLDATYLWSTGDTDPVLTGSQSGQYAVEVFKDDCIFRDTVLVLDTRENESFTEDMVICSDEPLLLSSPLPGDYLWSNGEQSQEITISSSGQYSVSVSNDCGEFTFATTVEVEDCECDIYVPNVFSPNNDGANDFLEIYVGCDFKYELKNFELFDRWGEQVYSRRGGEEVKWNGTFRGKSLSGGVYVWLLEYEVFRDGISERRIEKGDVSILR